MSDDYEKQDGASMEKASVSEAVVPVVPAVPAVNTALKRQMKNRHIAMIRYLKFDLAVFVIQADIFPSSIGGVIGTGLFLGTATALQKGGPIGMLLAYMTVGSLCYAMMMCLGEMAAFLPIPGGHLTFAERFVDPAWSFAMGWLYCYSWTILLPTEISAASIVVNYWNKNINASVWITVFLAVVVTINFLGAGAYGEAEFIFCSVKVITITGLLVLGLVLDLGGGPNHDRIGFRYWKQPGPFIAFDGVPGAKGHFLGWSAVMSQAAFSFMGSEVIAIAGAEAKNPRRSIPKAIRRVYIRLVLFYVGGVTLVGLLIINAAILTSAWSAANSDLYCSSRALYSLALNGNAPKVFMRVTRHGLPWVAVSSCAMFGALAYMGASSGSGKVFGWTAVAGMASWFGIGVTYIRFHRGLKAQGIDRRTLPFYSRLQPFAGWYTSIGCFLVVLFSGWTVFLKGNWATDTFVTNYLPMAMFPVLYVGAKIWKRARLVPYVKMDFESGLQEVLDASIEEPPPRNWVERIWSSLVSVLIASPKICC
ncbi:amino acid permease [Trametes elegans]|nr:amino acid permease [Trametes elegans]